MAAIARSLLLWCALAAAALAADARTEITGELERMASGLSSANADTVLRPVADSLPGRAQLEENVRAMLRMAVVATTIEPREWKTEGARTVVTLDWFLEMRRGGDGSVLASQRRRQLVTTEWEKQGKRWKLVSLSPLEFFAPPASQ